MGRLTEYTGLEKVKGVANKRLYGSGMKQMISQQEFYLKLYNQEFKNNRPQRSNSNAA